MNVPLIDYDQSVNRFVVVCPPWMNDVARGMPNRRWDSGRKRWSGPAIRANAEYLLSLRDAQITPEAFDAIQKCKDAAKPKISDSFPSFYRFKTEPRPFQKQCLQKLYGNKVGALLMDMGTGKSKCYIDIASAMRIEGKIERVVVVCPLSIMYNWSEQIRQHCPIPTSIHCLDTMNLGAYERWLSTPHDFKWLFVGVESLSQGSAFQHAEKYMLGSTKVAMCVDESSKIKNHKANRSQRVVSLGKMAEYRHIMTGTPVSHGPMDLYMQFEFLDPNIIGIGDFYSFRNRYAEMGGYEGKQIIGYNNLDELTSIIAPFSFQVQKADVFKDLPPKVYTVRTVPLTAEQKDIYRKVKASALVEWAGKGEIKVENVLVKALRLSEICSGIVTVGDILENNVLKHEIQTKKLEELLETCDETELPTIVWCRFRIELRNVAEALRKKYGEGSVVEFHGDIDDAGRKEAIDSFMSGKARFFVANQATGGMGLNLQKAQVEIYMSNSYNSIDREQSEDRAHRYGQLNSVNIIDIVCEGTIDEKVLQCLRDKKDLSVYIRELIQKGGIVELFN